MNCTNCNKPIEGKLKYLAYYANGMPVYWKKCDECMKERWVKYRDKILREA